MTTMLTSADVVAANAADPCPAWCTDCCLGVRHSSDPIRVDTGQAEFRLCLVQWADHELAAPGWEPVQVSLWIAHHTEIAEGGIDPDNGLPIGLTLCAGVDLDEMPALIEAQQRLLRLRRGGCARMSERCTCTVDAAGTRYEMRVLDSSCPVHGDEAEAARLNRARVSMPGPSRGCAVADPTWPGEIPHDVGLVQLAEQAMRHGGALFEHRHGFAHLTDQERVGHSLAELAYTAALSERALCGRWVVAVEALNAGASAEQVAAALGLEADELHAGLRAWAHGQLRFGLMTPPRHAEVLALLPEQATEAGGSDD